MYTSYIILYVNIFCDSTITGLIKMKKKKSRICICSAHEADNRRVGKIIIKIKIERDRGTSSVSKDIKGDTRL